MTEAPWMWIIGGPDGAGKSTLAAALLPDLVETEGFVNADEIARALAVDGQPAAVARAQEVLSARVFARVATGQPFAVEHPLDGPLLLEPAAAWRTRGGIVGVIWIWLDSAGRSAERLQARIDAGGPHADPAAVPGRYVRARRHLHGYLDAADGWLLLDNSAAAPRRIAEGGEGKVRKFHPRLYHAIVGDRRERAVDDPVFAGDWSAHVERRFVEAVARRQCLERLLDTAR